MKTFLLAAGYGTRLKPMTDIIPKCLVSISGKPLLHWWMLLLKKYKINDILLNTHYLASNVEAYIKINNQNKNLPFIHESYERELLGSGGTVRANYEFVKDEDCFLICYADNLTNVDLGSLVKFHKSHDGILTMGLFHTNTPEQCGIATLDQFDRIVKFVEKPKYPDSNLANAGIYVCSPKIYDYFPDRDFLDFGKDVLPLLVNKMYGLEVKGYLRDIGTPENYALAQKEWQP